MVKQSYDDLVFFNSVNANAQKFLDMADLIWEQGVTENREDLIALASHLRKVADEMVHVKTKVANLAVESAELSEWFLS